MQAPATGLIQRDTVRDISQQEKDRFLGMLLDTVAGTAGAKGKLLPLLENPEYAKVAMEYRNSNSSIGSVKIYDEQFEPRYQSISHILANKYPRPEPWMSYEALRGLAYMNFDAAREGLEGAVNAGLGVAGDKSFGVSKSISGVFIAGVARCNGHMSNCLTFIQELEKKSGKEKPEYDTLDEKDLKIMEEMSRLLRDAAGLVVDK